MRSTLPILILLPALLGNSSCEAPAAAGPLPEPGDSVDLAGGDEDVWADACFPSFGLRCGDALGGDTLDPNSGYTDVIDHWDLAIGDYSGPEVAYWYDSDFGGPTTFSLLDPAPSEMNQDLFVLEASNGCHSPAAIARGFNSVTFEAEAGRRYYLVVDGYNGDAGAFEVQLDCERTAPVELVEPAPEAPSGCLFGADVAAGESADWLDWEQGIAQFAALSDLPAITRAQLEEAWGIEDGVGTEAVWGLMDDGVWLDRITDRATGERYDWLRCAQYGMELGFVYRAGTTELVAYDAARDWSWCGIQR